MKLHHQQSSVGCVASLVYGDVVIEVGWEEGSALSQPLAKLDSYNVCLLVWTVKLHTGIRPLSNKLSKPLQASVREIGGGVNCKRRATVEQWTLGTYHFAKGNAQYYDLAVRLAS